MMFLLLSSCDEVERHKVLTFFFDGVPPLQTETSETQVTRPEGQQGGGQCAGRGLARSPAGEELHQLPRRAAANRFLPEGAIGGRGAAVVLQMP